MEARRPERARATARLTAIFFFLKREEEEVEEKK